jgi:hypothetical protein
MRIHLPSKLKLFHLLNVVLVILVSFLSKHIPFQMAFSLVSIQPLHIISCGRPP